MPHPTEQRILEALRRLRAPDGGDFDACNMIEGLNLKNTADGVHVCFALAVEAQNADAFEPLREIAEQTVRKLPGVASVSAVLTAHKAAPAMRGKREKLVIPGVRQHRGGGVGQRRGRQIDPSRTTSYERMRRDFWR
jgi:hypothetical protein